MTKRSFSSIAGSLLVLLLPVAPAPAQTRVLPATISREEQRRVMTQLQEQIAKAEAAATAAEADTKEAIDRGVKIAGELVIAQNANAGLKSDLATTKDDLRTARQTAQTEKDRADALRTEIDKLQSAYRALKTVGASLAGAFLGLLVFAVLDFFPMSWRAGAAVVLAGAGFGSVWSIF